MIKKILVINGSPSTNSFTTAVTSSYINGLKMSNTSYRVIYLNKLTFDPVLHEGYNKKQSLEDDLVSAQEDILWSDHIVFIFPTWWGSVPALLKGFLDRVLIPNFAFKYKPKSLLWYKLLKGRSSHLIILYGGPEFGNRFILGNPVVKMMKRNVLEFCGIKVNKITYIGGLRLMKLKRRKRWLDIISNLGSNIK